MDDPISDEIYLNLAIDLSTLAPGGRNYRVGAILVKEGRLIGTGYSWERGKGTHAEENLFNNLKKGEARGATLYCSMAPCTHRSSGKECCSHRVTREGVRRVVFACIAPDEPREKLSGKRVEFIHFSSLESKAKAINPHIYQG